MAQKGAKDISETGDNEKSPEAHEEAANQRHENHPRDLRLLDLNEPCLLAILSYLDKEDLLSMRFTHPCFQALFVYSAKRRKFFRKFILDAESLKQYPLETAIEVYKAIGELTVVMDVIDVAEEVIKTVLPFFSNLEELGLRALRLKDVKAIETFPTVNSLTLDTGGTDKPYLNALLKRSASVMTHLDCFKAPRAEFELLPDLELLAIDGIRLGKKSQFWRTNKTLKVFGIKFKDDREDPDPIFHDWDVVRDNLRDISQMKNVTNLQLYGISEKNMIPKIIPRFDYLVGLFLSIYDVTLVLPLLSNVGPLLTDLRLVYQEDYLEMVDDSHIVFVEALELISTRFPALGFFELNPPLNDFERLSFTEEETKPLYALSNLQTLLIDLETPEATYALFRNIPNLVMVHSGIQSPPATSISPEFAEFLKTENRRVQIFGCK